MKIPRLLSLTAAAFVALAGGLRAEVVIHEIYFRPAGIPENTKGEFIELRNTEATSVNVGGWQFTKGISFTFAAGTSIAAGGYLVVAADLPTFAAQHPGVTNVVGNWSGTLGNSGEQIKLVDALAVTRDSVTFSTEGDWGQRVRETVFGGWDWANGANGGGFSLELRNTALDNDRGQNWKVSTVGGGTPGVANSAASTNIEPIVSDVKHFPASPRPTEPVTISCKLLDETPAGGLAATLFWRNATTATPGAFNQVVMTGDGAGRFSTTLAAMANLTIVEFYVQASDGVLTRTWPAATSEGQNANCAYQETNEVFNATDSYYLLVLTAAENAAYTSLASSNPNSDRQFNQTLVVVRGTDATIRYRSSMRIRGNSSRSYQFKPLRITMPNDDLWDGAAVFALNPKASFLQYFGMRAFNAGGVRASESVPVELRRNGVESTTSTGTTPDYGKWARLEDENNDLVKTHWPAANGGNLYKKIDNGGSLNFYWRTGQAAPANPDLLLDGWSKQNNSSANDWSDLTSFFQTVQAAAKPHFTTTSTTDVAGSNATRISGIGTWNSTALTAAEITSLETVADLDQWARWFAVMTILQDLETKISNGVDDDYAAYFVPSAGGQKRMQLVAHDLDTILGQGDNPQAFGYTGLYDATEGGQSGYTFRTLLPLFGTTAVAGNAAFRAKYFAAIQGLYGSAFNANTTGNANPPFYQFIDSHLGGWVPTATLTAMKTFATQRQTYLLGLIGGAATPPAAPTSTATLAGPHGNLFISEVLARNVAAFQNGAGFPDFIEIFNGGASSANLGGMSLTDDPLLPAKYVFPAGTTIASGGYLVVFADADAAAPGLHTGFALDQDGDTVRLHDTVANAGALIDSVTFGPQAADLSVSRTGAGLDVWALTAPTRGAANGAAVALGNLAALRLNEIATNPDYLIGDDFAELYNPGAQPVALGGVAITDDAINYPTRHVLLALSYIGAGDFVVLRPKGSSASAGNPTELSFKLGANTASVAILGANGSPIDTLESDALPEDWSRGRSPDGGATLALFGLAASIPTPGAANTAPPAGIFALLNQLRVTEILYAPNELEFVELRNIGATALDLSGVRFTKGIEYTFAAGTTLAPGAFIVVCAERAPFIVKFGALATLAAGAFTGTLDNADDTITLQPPPPWDVNILSFTYSGSWYAETDLGRSLVVASPATALARDWGQRETWTPSSQLNGSPGVVEPLGITSALTASGILDSAFTYQIVASQTPTSYSASGLPGTLGINTTTGIISGTLTQTGVFNVQIGATNANGSDSKTLVISIAAFGPLAGFEWAAIGAQTAGVPFTVTLRARDAGGHTVTTFNGTAQVSAGAISSTPNGTVNIVNGVWTGQFTVLVAAGAVELQAVISGQPLVRSNTFAAPAPTMNVPPSFTAGANQTVPEDAGLVLVSGWAKNISPGFSSETGQVVSFFASADNPALFAAQPTVATNGVLAFRPAPDASGSATVTVFAKDDGGTANGGNDTSATQTFTITVLSVNDAPTIVAGGNIAVVQNAGAQTFAWASGIGTGAPNEAAQALTIEVVASAPSLFSTQPALAADGTLTFTPAPNVVGTANVTVTVRDDGGTANGGTDTTQRTFQITMRVVNRAPTFTGGGNVTSGIRAAFARDWAGDISAGEAAQTVAFSAIADHPELFTVPPSVSSAGRLTFTGGTRTGLATVTVRLTDNGGTADGGVDTSEPSIFTIRLTSAAEAQGAYRGLAGPAGGTAPGHARLGCLQIAVTATGAFSGRVSLGGNSWAVAGGLNHSGTAIFTSVGAIQLLPRAGLAALRFSFHADFSATTPTLVGQFVDGVPIADVVALRDGYSAANHVPASLADAANGGLFTVIFPALAAPNGGLDADGFPRGDGWATVAVGALGAVNVRGQSADGAVLTYTAGLDAANSFPLYIPLYGGRGAIGGRVVFNTTATTHLETTGLVWYRPALPTAAQYPQGWPNGIALGLDGSPRNYVTQPNVLPIGSAVLALDGGGLATGGLSQTFAAGVGNRIAPVLPNPRGFVLTMRLNGSWGGSFVHPVTGKRVPVQGVILGDRGNGTGFFSGGTSTGRATLGP